MRKCVDSQIWGEDGLERTANSKKISKLIHAIIALDEHKCTKENKNTAHVQRKHGLDRPLAGE